jgi:hypothetical protein
MTIRRIILKRKKLLASAALLLIALSAAKLYNPESKPAGINVGHTGILPEESVFDIQTGKYIDVAGIDAKYGLKERILNALGLNDAQLAEKQAFYITLNVHVDAPNSTLLGLEYSNLAFSELRPAYNRHPPLFIYKSPVCDEKTVKRYLLNDTEGKLDLVGIVNEITVLKDSSRSIKDSIRITLHNATQNTDEPLESLDYRITVCSARGC